MNVPASAIDRIEVNNVDPGHHAAEPGTLGEMRVQTMFSILKAAGLADETCNHMLSEITTDQLGRLLACADDDLECSPAATGTNMIPPSCIGDDYARIAAAQTEQLSERKRQANVDTLRTYLDFHAHSHGMPVPIATCNNGVMSQFVMLGGEICTADQAAVEYREFLMQVRRAAGPNHFSNSPDWRPLIEAQGIDIELLRQHEKKSDP